MPKQIAPRLKNGDKRVSIGHGLPPQIKEAIKAIAASENRSVSWVLEEVVIDYFSLRRPRYIDRKIK